MTLISFFSSYLDGDQISSVPKPEACIAAIMKGARLIECETEIFNCLYNLDDCFNSYIDF